MSQSASEYLGHYARLAKEFATRPRVLVRIPNNDCTETVLLGELQVLDLRQDSGYGAGVMFDRMSDGGKYKFYMQRAEYVHLFSEYKAQLLQLFDKGATWDGNLIGKDDAKALRLAGLAEKCPNGWTIITTAGVAEVLKLNWRHA